MNVPQEEVIARRQAIGTLLSTTQLNLGQIAKEVGVTRERVRQIQHRFFPDYPRRKQKRAQPKCGVRFIRRELIRILRAAGYRWCYRCRTVKCLDEFSPKARERNGMACRRCSTERTTEHYRNSPKARAHYAKYRQEHKEAGARAHKRWLEKHGEAIALVRDFKRLEKYAPLLADAVRHGETTLEEAVEKLSERSFWWTRVRRTPQGFATAIRRTLAPREQEELRRLLDEGADSHDRVD